MRFFQIVVLKSPGGNKLSNSSKVFVAGHHGMVGSAIVRKLHENGFDNIITRSRTELDLLNQQDVREFLLREKPDQIYLAAAKVGGIHANDTYPAEFIHQNLMIQSNIINSAMEAGIEKLLFLGSSCIYPKQAPQPMKESALLSGYLESTNEPYAIAKIAGIKMCESYNRQFGVDYRSVMPTNLYGPGDNYHPENSHVIPALIRRFHDAHISALPEVKVWGTGKVKREFLHVDDLASACLHVMNLDKDVYKSHTQPMCSHINVGYGEDVTIAELANSVASTIGYEGTLAFDSTKPDGTPRKLMDSSLLLDLGWSPCISLEDGLKRVYEEYKGLDQQKLRA
jgi:GDP-L-fucose synthase